MSRNFVFNAIRNQCRLSKNHSMLLFFFFLLWFGLVWFGDQFSHGFHKKYCFIFYCKRSTFTNYIFLICLLFMTEFAIAWSHFRIESAVNWIDWQTFSKKGQGTFLSFLSSLLSLTIGFSWKMDYTYWRIACLNTNQRPTALQKYNDNTKRNEEWITFWIYLLSCVWWWWWLCVRLYT